MKKLIALLVAMMMLLAMPFAYAEEEAEMPFEGEWYDFEYFMVYLPSDWTEIEVTDDMAESGFYCVLVDAEGAHSMQFAYSELEEETTAEALVAQFQEAYGEENVTAFDVNGVTFFGYNDAEKDAVCIMALDPVDLGLYMFVFMPSSDADFMQLADAILATVTFADGTEAAAE